MTPLSDGGIPDVE